MITEKMDRRIAKSLLIPPNLIGRRVKTPKQEALERLTRMGWYLWLS